MEGQYTTPQRGFMSPIHGTSSASTPGHPGFTITQSTMELLCLQRTHFRAFWRQLQDLKVDDINDKWELEDELRNINLRWETIDSLHIQIDNILEGLDMEYDKEFYAIEASYKKIKRALNQKLASTAHIQHSTPQIEIPTFFGDYTQWPTFCDLYMQIVHNNHILTKSQKMQHLKGKLRGEAERLIQHLSITSDNYDAAWEILTHRYRNPQLIFTTNVELLLNVPNMHEQSTYEIKRLFDISTECLHAIQTLGVDTSTWGPLLVHLITKKLDSKTYSAYSEARKSPRDLPTLKELMNFLEAKFMALEPINIKEKEHNMSSPYKHSQQRCPPYSGYDHPGKSQHKKEFQVAVAYTWKCPLCYRGHGLYSCPKFIGLANNSKLHSVQKLNVCENCLYKHADNACNSSRRCKLCQEFHHTLLHYAIEADITTTTAKRTKQGKTSAKNKITYNCHVVTNMSNDKHQREKRSRQSKQYPSPISRRSGSQNENTYKKQMKWFQQNKHHQDKKTQQYVARASERATSNNGSGCVKCNIRILGPSDTADMTPLKNNDPLRIVRIHRYTPIPTYPETADSNGDTCTLLAPPKMVAASAGHSTASASVYHDYYLFRYDR